MLFKITVEQLQMTNSGNKLHRRRNHKACVNLNSHAVKNKGNPTRVQSSLSSCWFTLFAHSSMFVFSRKRCSQRKGSSHTCAPTCFFLRFSGACYFLSRSADILVSVFAAISLWPDARLDFTRASGAKVEHWVWRQTPHGDLRRQLHEASTSRISRQVVTKHSVLFMTVDFSKVVCLNPSTLSERFVDAWNAEAGRPAKQGDCCCFTRESKLVSSWRKTPGSADRNRKIRETKW